MRGSVTMSAVNLIVDEHTRIVIVKLPDLLQVKQADNERIGELITKQSPIKVLGYSHEITSNNWNKFVMIRYFGKRQAEFITKKETFNFNPKRIIFYNTFHMSGFTDQVEIIVNLYSFKEFKIPAKNVGLLFKDEVKKFISEPPILPPLWNIVMDYLPRYISMPLPINKEIFNTLEEEAKKVRIY